MVSPSKSRKSKPVRKGNGVDTTTKHEKGKHLKPLAKKKFFFDIKDRNVSTKLGARLTYLGGVVECNLRKEVDYVITDRLSVRDQTKKVEASTSKCAGSSSVVSSGISAAPVTLNAPRGHLEATQSKTSADEMLERTQHKAEKNKVDVLDLANTLGISVWPLEKVFKWLEKVKGICLKNSSHFKSKTTKTTEIKAPFIKFEACNKQYQPVYKELQLWPSINLNGCSGSSPFSASKPVGEKTQKKKNEVSGSSNRSQIQHRRSRMTRKVKTRLDSSSENNFVGLHKSGYCEICKSNYSNIEHHVKSEKHINFAKNDKNFLSIDHLIKTGPNIESFLKMNGTKDFSGCQIFGTRRSTRGTKVNRTWSIDNSLLWSDDESNEDISKKSFSEVHTRRTNLRYSVDERHMKGRKYSSEIHCNGIRHHTTQSKSESCASPVPEVVHKPCESSAKEEDQPKKNSSVSSGHHLRSRHVSAKCEREEDSNVTCHRLRHGRYSLGALCERNLQNFHTREPVKCEMVLRDRSKFDYVMGRSESSEEENFSDEMDEIKQSGGGKKLQNSHMKSNSANHTIKKKRLSAEEKFLEDNKDYYKVEVLAAKLRSSGYFLSQRERELELARRAESAQEERNSSASPKQESNTSSKHEPNNSPKQVSNSSPKQVSSTSPKPIANNTPKPVANSTLKSVPNNTLKPVANSTPKPVSNSSPKQVSNSSPKQVSNVRCNGGFVESEKEVRPKRARRSELAVLSDEAECFMFGEPVKRDSSVDSSSSETDETPVNETTKPCVGNETNRSKSTKNSHSDEIKDSINGLVTNKCNAGDSVCDSVRNESATQDGNNSDSSLTKKTNKHTAGKKKRRTQAEAFIRDNLDYYKFELSESRLRAQHDSIHNEAKPDVSSIEDSCKSGNDKKDDVSVEKGSGIKEESEEHNGGSDELPAKVDELQFSFESIPRSEPWYQTYQRQDEGEEFYISLGETCLWKPFLLPYEMPVETFLLPNKTVFTKRPMFHKRSSKLALLARSPRKSPRCHASTLAIMSSFKKDTSDSAGKGSSELAGKGSSELVETVPTESESDCGQMNITKSDCGQMNITKSDCGQMSTTKSDCGQMNITQSDCGQMNITKSDCGQMNITKSDCGQMNITKSDCGQVNISKSDITSDFRSESDNEMSEIARNIEVLLTNACESTSDDSKSVLPKPVAKNKGKRRKKKCLGSSDEKVEEIDPTVLAELENNSPISTSPNFSSVHRVPCPDVISLLNFSHCQCVDKLANVVASTGSGCDNLESNSECASTCDTVSDIDSRWRLGRRRFGGKKRKINMTGWPRTKPKKKKKCDTTISVKGTGNPTTISVKGTGNPSVKSSDTQVPSNNAKPERETNKNSSLNQGKNSPRTPVSSDTVKVSECKQTRSSSECKPNRSSETVKEVVHRKRKYKMIYKPGSKNSLKLVIRKTTTDSEEGKSKSTDCEEGKSKSTDSEDVQKSTSEDDKVVKSLRRPSVLVKDYKFEKPTVKLSIKSHKGGAKVESKSSGSLVCKISTRQSDRCFKEEIKLPKKVVNRDLRNIQGKNNSSSSSSTSSSSSCKFDRTSRTSIDSASSLEYQPCVRVEKMPDLGRCSYSVKGVHLNKTRRGIPKRSGNKKTAKKYTNVRGDMKSNSSIPSKSKNFIRRASPRKPSTQLIARWEVWPSCPR